MRYNTTLRYDNRAEQLVQPDWTVHTSVNMHHTCYGHSLLIIFNGKLKMTWYDTRLLVIAGSIPSKLKNLRSQVLEDSSEIDRSTSTNTLCVVALLQQTVNTPDGELYYKITRALWSVT